MLMEGMVIEDTVSRNMSNKLGCELDLFHKGDRVRISDAETLPDGTWYYVPGSGWLKARDVSISRDVEFAFKAKEMGIMDLQLFSFNLSSLTKVVSNTITSSTRKINTGALVGTTGIFGSSSTSSVNANQSTSSVLKSLGISVSSTSIFGKVLSSTSIGSLSTGNIVDTLLGSLMDQVFDSVFSRLKYVIGFDATSALFSLLSGEDGDIGTLDATGYSGMLDPYTAKSWTELDYKASIYFNYLGCDGQMITRSFDDLSWEQDAYYSTPTLTPKQIPSEVTFNQSLFNADYSEFETALAATKKYLNLSIERNDWFVNFNRYRITHPDYHLVGSRAYVFMTRPDLNIFDSTASAMNDSIKYTSDAAFFYNAVLKHPTICQSLSSSLSGSHDFIPLISNTARSLDVQDLSIKTVEHGETLTGWKLVYAKNSIDSKTAGSISMNFIDDNMLSITYMHSIWLTYIDGVVRGIIDPKASYIRNGIIDYASSLYYILTDQSGENIIYWTKYYGIIPTNVPYSALSFNEGSPIHTPEVQIQYAYSFKDDMNPLALAEFNRNSPNTFSYVPIYNENTFKCNGSIVGPPFIDTEDSGVTYKLRFRPREDT